jgi:hypothetical protein
MEQQSLKELTEWNSIYKTNTEYDELEGLKDRRIS